MLSPSLCASQQTTDTDRKTEGEKNITKSCKSEYVVYIEVNYELLSII